MHSFKQQIFQIKWAHSMLVSVLGAKNTTEQDIFPDFINCTCNQKRQNLIQCDRY